MAGADEADFEVISKPHIDSLSPLNRLSSREAFLLIVALMKMGGTILPRVYGKSLG
jgi:hypothetical protein